MAATINDVARLAGVSKKTVSRVLNNEKNVRAETRAKVYAAIEQLGYRPNVSAQRLASGKSRMVGLIFHKASWHYIDLVLQGILDAIDPKGYSLLMQSCGADNQEDMEKVVQMVMERRVDGLIFIPPTDRATDVLAQLSSWQIPFVRLSPWDRTSAAPYVSLDDRQGAFEMTSHLLALGHRRIGFIMGNPDHRASHDRLEGYKKALVAYQVPLSPSLIKQGDFFFESGRQAALELLTAPAPPTAIFASNDDMATGVLNAAHSLGLDAPRELSVGGFDDVLLAHQVWPPLTTVRQPIYDMAGEAARILLQLLHGESPHPPFRILTPTLVVRQSTARVPSGSESILSRNLSHPPPF